MLIAVVLRSDIGVNTPALPEASNESTMDCVNPVRNSFIEAKLNGLLLFLIQKHCIYFKEHLRLTVKRMALWIHSACSLHSAFHLFVVQRMRLFFSLQDVQRQRKTT